MKRIDLETLEARMMEEVVKRRQLGGYSVEAEALLTLSEAVLKVVSHILDESPRERVKTKNAPTHS
jgi:hypothetical protein